MQIFSNKIFSNSLWMIIEKIISIFGLIFVNALMAKYIGPENFGKLAFTTSIFIFVQTLAWFGAQNIIFKRLSQNLKSGLKLTLATQKTRQIYCILASSIALIYLWFYADTLTFIFGLGNFVASFFIVSDFYSIYNNSLLISYVNAITNIIGLIVGLILRYFLVFIEAEPYTMVYPIVVISVVPFLLRRIYHLKRVVHQNIVPVGNKYNKYLFFTGGSLVISSLSIIIYVQISNIFLAKISSFSELAVYNVAFTLGSAWGFVNNAFITSYFPKIYAEKSTELQLKYLRHIHILVLCFSCVAFFFLILFGRGVVNLLYGKDYLNSVELLPYMVIGTLLSSLGTISYRYMLNFDAYKYLSVKMMVVAIFSVFLSYFLISHYGVLGASICFVLVEFFSLTVANYFFKNGTIFKIHASLLFFK